MEKLQAVSELRQFENYQALFLEFKKLQLNQKAEQTLLVALEKVPEHPVLLENLAGHYLEMGNLEKALTTANRYVKYHPEDHGAFLLRARVYDSLDDERKAMRDYERAIRNRETDLPFLERLIDLKASHGSPEEALDLIHAYQVILHRPTLMVNKQARLYLQTGKTASAFNILRSALVYKPHDKQVLKDYLKMSNLSSRRLPAEVYEILQVSLPKLAILDEQELKELQVDYDHQKGNYGGALEVLNELLMTHPDHFPWRKLRAVLKLEMGKIEDSVEELRVLFLQQPNDVEVRCVLENYYLMQSATDEWKELVKKAMMEDHSFLEVFDYLRSIGGNRDWLSQYERKAKSLSSEIRKLGNIGTDIFDTTYRKLPAYTLKTFIAYLSTYQRIPVPKALFDIISANLGTQSHEPPFEIEDLEAAYPVWLFGINIYQRFREKKLGPCRFLPDRFLSDQVALEMEIDQHRIDIDISLLLSETSGKLKTGMHSGTDFSWRFQKEYIPEGQPSESIPIFNQKQFARVIDHFKKDLSEADESFKKSFQKTRKKRSSRA